MFHCIVSFEIWQCELGIKREDYRWKLGIYSCSLNRKCIVTTPCDLKISVCQRYLDAQIQGIECADRYRKIDLLSEFAHTEFLSMKLLLHLHLLLVAHCLAMRQDC